MVATDKLSRDLSEWTRQSGTRPTSKDFEALRSRFIRAIGKIPEGTVNSVFTTFLSLYASNGPRAGQGALDWLATVGSLLLMDYDGQPLSREEWAEIRDIVSHDSDRIDLDLLTYVLGQVMDHGG
ncbi:MAG: hypothetical protein KKI09_12235, partial [Spirochaetes bacterium]|nr:hypothetical protein [Spirochaetota bacterium]MBU0956189.1 hypothetical protein [Spirochaetota bacterium]